MVGQPPTSICVADSQLSMFNMDCWTLTTLTPAVVPIKMVFYFVYVFIFIYIHMYIQYFYIFLVVFGGSRRDI